MTNNKLNTKLARATNGGTDLTVKKRLRSAATNRLVLVYTMQCLAPLVERVPLDPRCRPLQTHRLLFGEDAKGIARPQI